jgi:serine/threonine protein kinase
VTGSNVDTDEDVAIKLEHHTIDPSFLEYETEIYKSLSGRTGFPLVYWSGFQDDYRALVFELLGPNLEDLFRYCGNQFSLKTTLMIADQLLYRFESLHSKEFLHRDVKPDNFLIGTGGRGNHIYMTDLGLATYHNSKRTMSPDAYISKSQLVGTARYASINGHLERGR